MDGWEDCALGHLCLVTKWCTQHRQHNTQHGYHPDLQILHQLNQYWSGLCLFLFKSCKIIMNKQCSWNITRQQNVETYGLVIVEWLKGSNPSGVSSFHHFITDEKQKRSLSRCYLWKSEPNNQKGQGLFHPSSSPKLQCDILTFGLCLDAVFFFFLPYVKKSLFFFLDDCTIQSCDGVSSEMLGLRKASRLIVLLMYEMEIWCTHCFGDGPIIALSSDRCIATPLKPGVFAGSISVLLV